MVTEWLSQTSSQNTSHVVTAIPGSAKGVQGSGSASNIEGRVPNSQQEGRDRWCANLSECDRDRAAHLFCLVIEQVGEPLRPPQYPGQVLAR